MEPMILPSAKRLAEENGLNWRKIRGTGSAGAIGDDDVMDYLMRVMMGDEDLPEGSVDPIPDTLAQDMAAMQSMIAGSGMADPDELKTIMAQTPVAPVYHEPEPVAAAPIEPVVAYTEPEPEEDLFDMDDFELVDDTPVVAAPAYVSEAVVEPQPVAASVESMHEPVHEPEIVHEVITEPVHEPVHEPITEPMAVIAELEPTLDNQDFDALLGAPPVLAATVDVQPVAAEPVHELEPVIEPVLEPVHEVIAEPVHEVHEVHEVIAEPVLEPVAALAEPVLEPVAAVAAFTATPIGKISDISMRVHFDVSALLEAQTSLEPLIGKVPLGFLVARAVSRHAHLLGLSSVSQFRISDSSYAPLKDIASDFKSALEDFHSAPLGSASGIAITDAGELGLEEISTDAAQISVSLGKIHGEHTGLTFRGEAPVQVAAAFLNAVANSLHKPITLLV